MALPAGRSSHDLAIVDDQLVVAGGWELRGSVEDPRWERTVLALDLKALDKNTAGKWEVLTETPIGVRANAAVGFDGKLWVLGGLDDNGDTTRARRHLRSLNRPMGFGPRAARVRQSERLRRRRGDGSRRSPSSARPTGASTASGAVTTGGPTPATWTNGVFFHRLVSDGESLFAIGGAKPYGSPEVGRAAPPV